MASYLVVLTVFTNQERWELLWKYQFWNNVFFGFCFCFATALFGKAHNRINKLQKLLVDPRNKAVLHRSKIISGYSLFVCCAFNFVVISWIAVQGSVGACAVTEYIIESSTMLIAEVGAFYLVIYYNLDLTLKSQVLTTGCTYLVGTDTNNVEQIKYYISTTDQINSNDMLNGELTDGFTDDGVSQSNVNTPSSISQAGSPFVSEFQGESYGTGRTPTEKHLFSINDDSAAPGSPQNKLPSFGVKND